MDETKLAELFRDAVRDAPPASFDSGDVRAASARAAARSRHRALAGGALALALLAGGTVTAVTLTDDSPTNAAAPASAPDNRNADAGGTMTLSAPEAAPLDSGGSGTTGSGPGAAAGSPRSGPTEAPKQGGPLSGSAGPTTGGTPGGCEQADRELAVALAGELPAAAGREALTVPFGCPPGTRGVAVRLADAGRTGVVSVLVLPAGTALAASPGSEVPGTIPASAEALRSGGTVYVVTQPDPGVAEPPFAEDVPRVAVAIGRGN